MLILYLANQHQFQHEHWEIRWKLHWAQKYCHQNMWKIIIGFCHWNIIRSSVVVNFPCVSVTLCIFCVDFHSLLTYDSMYTLSLSVLFIFPSISYVLFSNVPYFPFSCLFIYTKAFIPLTLLCVYQRCWSSISCAILYLTFSCYI